MAGDKGDKCTMILIDTLDKPYTLKARIDFVAKYMTDTIKETETELQAWGYTEEEKEQQRQEEINNLTMTPLDFIKVLMSLGLTLEQVNAFLESHLEVKMQLTYCNSVYCGVVKSFLPITIGELVITPQMVEQAFIFKNESEVQNVNQMD